MSSLTLTMQGRSLTVDFSSDDEMKAALMELAQAESMFNNATNAYRADEAIHRMSAANSRIQAIIHERREADAQKVAGAVQKE